MTPQVYPMHSWVPLLVSACLGGFAAWYPPLFESLGVPIERTGILTGGLLLARWGAPVRRARLSPGNAT